MNDDTTAQSSAPGVWPCLRYRDAPAALEFLTGVLGFTQTARYGDGDRLDHAEIRWPGGGGVMLGSDKPGDSTVPVAVGTVYLVMPGESEIIALYERVQASAGRVVRPLERPDYGGAEFAVADPEGVIWSIGTYAGERPRKGVSPGSRRGSGARAEVSAASCGVAASRSLDQRPATCSTTI